MVYLLIIFSELLVPVDGSARNSPVRGEFEMDDDDLAALLTEQLYMELPSQQHLTGEIRGQIRRISKYIEFYKQYEHFT